MNPLLAITTTMVPEAGAHKRPEVALYAAYMALFEEIGLHCVLITPAHSTFSVRRLMAMCSGLLLTGGEDVDPARYDAEPSPLLRRVNPARDAVEFEALGCALELGMPVLGICRGFQLLNVYLGGTLYQDLPTEYPKTLTHLQIQPWGQSSHHAHVESGSQLHREIRTHDLFINSFHHQGVKELAPDLRAVAWAEDGLIEAAELRSRPWVFGVQWHPERHEAVAEETNPDRRLLTGFGKEVMRRRPQEIAA